MKRFLATILFVSLVMALASCATNASTVPVTKNASPENNSSVPAPDGGTLVRAMTSEPAGIDPQGAPSSGLSLVLPYLFDTLVVRDTNNNTLPSLATSWETAADGKSITMKLKPKVRFQDDSPFNATAVKFTFERFKETGAKSPIYGGIQQIDQIEVVDDLTVRFTFREPAANFWSTISMPYAALVSPASAEKVKTEGKGNLVGTGPFTLAEWRPGQSLTLKRNPDYAWGPALSQNQSAPHLESLVFKVIPDANTQLAALDAGEVDAIFINQPEHRLALEKNPTVQLHETVLNSLVFLGYNTKKTPFDDVRVRQALSYAVDKEAVVQLALGGLGLVADAALPPSLPGYSPSLKPFGLGHDPEKAKALLGEAGFLQALDGTWSKDGETLQGVLLTSNRPPNDTIAALLQSQFKAIGVPVEIQMLDGKAVMEASSAGNFDLLLWRYDWNDPDALNIFLGSKRIGTTNRVAYSNAEVDKLLAHGARELDTAKRNELYVDAQKIILQDAPWQPLYVPLDVLAISKRIQDAQVGYMGRLLVNDARVIGK